MRCSSLACAMLWGWGGGVFQSLSSKTAAPRDRLGDQALDKKHRAKYPKANQDRFRPRHALPPGSLKAVRVVLPIPLSMVPGPSLARSSLRGGPQACSPRPRGGEDHHQHLSSPLTQRLPSCLAWLAAVAAAALSSSARCPPPRRMCREVVIEEGRFVLPLTVLVLPQAVGHQPQGPPLLEQDGVEAPRLHNVEDLVSATLSR